MGTSTDRTGGISMTGRGEVVTTKDEIGNRDRVGKSRLLSDRVYSGSQSSACSVERR